MENNYSQDSQRRVRNVPIRLESDRSDQYVNNQNHDRFQTDHSSHHRQQTNLGGHHHQYPGSVFDQSTPSHTSSININYKTSSPSPTSQSSRQRSDNNSSSHLSRENAGSKTTDMNREGNTPLADRNKSPQNTESTMEMNPSQCDTTESGPKEPDPIIPLPPPPEQSKPEKTHREKPSSQNRDGEGDEDQSKSSKSKQESVPQAIINSTKAEVNRLLQEIAECNETSLKSREYLRLDEQLTVCILKLDDIQTPELRQQRKDVINLINKCTELLERKINLNFDIKQLSRNSA